MPASMREPARSVHALVGCACPRAGDGEAVGADGHHAVLRALHRAVEDAHARAVDDALAHRGIVVVKLHDEALPGLDAQAAFGKLKTRFAPGAQA
jgi:hypothetical protein